MAKKPQLRLPDKIINTTGWHDAWLARMVSHCFSEVDLDPSAQWIKLARFSLAHNCDFRGWAYLGLRSIRVKINPLILYPFTLNRRVSKGIDVRNPIELVVMLTAHELAHLRWPDASENEIEKRGTDVMLDFRRNRFMVAESWGYPGLGPVRPETVYRVTCPTCGRKSYHARRPQVSELCCGDCFADRAACTAAKAAGSGLLVCDRVPTPADLNC